MRYELMIVSDTETVPAPEALLDDVHARGLLRVEAIARGGFDDPADAPRLVVAEEGGARVLVGFERAAYATAVGASLLDAPAPLSERLSVEDRALLERARLACHLRVSEPGSELGSALRLVVQLADALVLRMGGVVVDPQMMTLFGARRWLADRELGEVELRRHVMIHEEPIGDAFTLRTYGLVKFDRPELCVCEVPEADAEVAARLLDRVARMLAAGAKLADGERVQLAGDCSLIASDMQLPEGAPADERLLRLSDEGGMSASVALAALRV